MLVTTINPLSLFRRRISFRFDNYAWIVMCEVNKIELHQIAELQEKLLLITLMYGAYVSNCRYNARKELYKPEQIYDMFRKMTQEQIEEIKLAIYNSRLLGKTMHEWANETDVEEKKN